MAVVVQGGRSAAAHNWQRLLGSVSVRSISSTNSCCKNPSPLPGSPASSVPGKEEPVVKPKERKKLLVLGGNGFVGSHVCVEALTRGVPVVSLNRTGRPEGADGWVNNVVWLRGDLFDPLQWKQSLDEVQAVISCVGGFGTNDQMRRINGEANRTAVWAASKAGVKRFVYVSVADFRLPSFVLQGYFEGKRLAEDAVRSKFPYSGVILRPGFIYGDRKIAGVKVPLGMIASPLEAVIKQTKPFTQIPLVGPLLVPPVNVDAVAKAAVKAALSPVPPESWTCGALSASEVIDRAVFGRILSRFAWFSHPPRCGHREAEFGFPLGCTFLCYRAGDEQMTMSRLGVNSQEIGQFDSGSQIHRLQFSQLNAGDELFSKLKDAVLTFLQAGKLFVRSDTLIRRKLLITS